MSESDSCICVEVNFRMNQTSKCHSLPRHVHVLPALLRHDDLQDDTTHPQRLLCAAGKHEIVNLVQKLDAVFSPVHFGLGSLGRRLVFRHEARPEAHHMQDPPMLMFRHEARPEAHHADHTILYYTPPSLSCVQA